MKKFLLTLVLLVSGFVTSYALSINEIMSNPIGDDGGREWVEIYNNSSSTVDMSALTISIKGGAFIPITSVSGGVIISPEGYAIIGSTVSGATKFFQDYPTYSGPLFRSSMSLVNTGVTSIEIKLGGVSLDSIPSYTAAKEGLTYARIHGSFTLGTPTPGAENQPAPEDVTTTTTTSSTTTTQATIAQASAPTADIVLYMPSEKTVIAGAESMFSVFGLTRGGKPIENITYTWAYGDGGQSTGSSTMYRYAYPGRYIASVEGGNGYVIGTGRMMVKVVSPDISITSFGRGKYGSYVDILNPNPYDLDLSQWRLTLDGASFPFPKNTFLLGNETTRFSGLAMGFLTTTISTSSVIKIVFPNQEEVTRYTLASSSPALQKVPDIFAATKTEHQEISQKVPVMSNVIRVPSIVRSPKVVVDKTASSTPTFKNSIKVQGRDTRIVSFFKTFFGK